MVTAETVTADVVMHCRKMLDIIKRIQEEKDSRDPASAEKYEMPNQLYNELKEEFWNGYSRAVYTAMEKHAGFSEDVPIEINGERRVVSFLDIPKHVANRDANLHLYDRSNQETVDKLSRAEIEAYMLCYCRQERFSQPPCVNLPFCNMEYVLNRYISLAQGE